MWTAPLDLVVRSGCQYLCQLPTKLGGNQLDLFQFDLIKFNFDFFTKVCPLVGPLHILFLDNDAVDWIHKQITFNLLWLTKFAPFAYANLLFLVLSLVLSSYFELFSLFKTMVFILSKLDLFRVIFSWSFNFFKKRTSFKFLNFSFNFSLSFSFKIISF